MILVAILLNSTRRVLVIPKDRTRVQAYMLIFSNLTLVTVGIWFWVEISKIKIGLDVTMKLYPTVGTFPCPLQGRGNYLLPYSAAQIQQPRCGRLITVLNRQVRTHCISMWMIRLTMRQQFCTQGTNGVFPLMLVRCRNRTARASAILTTIILKKSKRLACRPVPLAQ